MDLTLSEEREDINKMKKTLTMLAALLLALVICATAVFAVAEEPVTEAPAAEEVAETVVAVEPAPVPDADTVLCTIGGKELTYGYVAPFIDNILTSYVSNGYDSNDASLIDFSNREGMYMAQLYTMLEVIGEELNVTLTDEQKAQATEEAVAEWDTAVEYFLQQQYGISDASTEEEKSTALASTLALLESMGYTQEAMVEEALTNAKWSSIMDAMCADIAITDEQVQTYLDEQIAAQVELYGNDPSYYEMMQYYGYPTYYRPDGYRAVTHILLKVDDALLENYSTLSATFEEQAATTEVEVPEGEETVEGEEPAETEEPAEPVTAEQVEEARQAILASVQATVDEIMAKFNAGTSFADLIVEYGNDPGMQQEGMLETGYEVAAGSIMWDLPFRDGAMAIANVGEVSEPVVGANGVHIIYYLKDIPGGPVTITPTEWESLRADLLSEAADTYINDTVIARLDAAEIVYTDAAAPYIPDLGTEETAEAAPEETAEATEAAQ